MLGPVRQILHSQSGKKMVFKVCMDLVMSLVSTSTYQNVYFCICAYCVIWHNTVCALNSTSRQTCVGIHNMSSACGIKCVNLLQKNRLVLCVSAHTMQIEVCPGALDLGVTAATLC